MIANTKGITTISPTWFFLKDNDGNIESLANSTYVNYCHQNGIEVWALVEDIKYKDTIIDYEILSRTSSRQRLVTNLIAKAIEYDLDGLNIDFEYIKEESSKAYLEFIRELSIMCRLNGIVLSVDNYRPADHNNFYNREEQGKVADYVVIMGYDEHYAGSQTAGSVASINWVREGIERTLEDVPSEKVINAVPFYTRLWEERPKTEEEIAESSETEEYNPVCGQQQAYAWDAGRQGPGSKRSREGLGRDDQGTVLRRIYCRRKDIQDVAGRGRVDCSEGRTYQEYKLAGIAAWKLGFERQDIWDVILRYVN